MSQMVYLFIQVPNLDVKIVGLMGGTTVIGRLEELAVSLPFQDISRQHAEIVVGPQGIVLKDLNSRNGTFLNGRLIAAGQEVPLHENDIIEIGSVKLWMSRDLHARDGASLEQANQKLLETLRIKVQKNQISDRRFCILSDTFKSYMEAENQEAVLHQLIQSLLVYWNDARCEIRSHQELLGKKIMPLDFSRSTPWCFDDRVWTKLNPEDFGNDRKIQSLAWPLSDLDVWVLIQWPFHIRFSLEDILFVSILIFHAQDVLRRIAADKLKSLWAPGRLVDISWAGSSPGIQAVTQMIQRVCASQSSVVLTGETGTGKEVAARMIHAGGSRAKKAWVSLNCAAIAENLMESELFGHEKGAFTGAHQLRIGKFEQADAGTLFLDEVGEMSLEVQKKLLRVLEQKEFTRVGGEAVIHCDVRIICATHRNLMDEVRQGRFREDLYYRLSVVSIRIPPLRERREDISELVEFFLRKFCREWGRSVPKVDTKALGHLENYHWPGNIRELRNALERALVLNHSDTLTADDFEFLGHEDSKADLILFDGTLSDARQRWEKEYLTRLLKKTEGQMTQASSEAGLARQNLYEALKRHELKPEDFRS